MTFVAAFIALVVGLVAGSVVTLRRAARSLARLSPDEARSPGTLSEALQYVATARRDDTERVAAMRSTVGRVEHALDALPYGLAIWIDGQQVTSNEPFRKLTGADRHGVTIRKLVDSTVAAARPGRAVVEERHDFDDHPRQSILVSANRLQDGTVTCIVQDITQRAYLEDVRRDFVANISHELRTPIGAMALLAETIADEPDAEIARSLAERMTNEAHRLSRIVEDLLELSRLEGGAQRVASWESTSAVFREALDRVDALAEERAVSIRRTVGVESILVDRRQIVSAIANLLDNAIRYSKPGGVVELEAEPRDGSVAFIVADHGIGIPSHELDRIFERFYRVDKARHHETGGTGLGLAIVRHVVTNHDGTVGVTSVEGVGSRFEIELPHAGGVEA